MLEILGGIGQPSLVGGAVRDLLLREAGRGPTTAGDVDVEVHGTRTDLVVGALRAAGAIVVEAGAGFPVLKVVLDGSRVDVAVTAESGALDPVTVSALGRDFTVNAVAWDPPHERVPRRGRWDRRCRHRRAAVRFRTLQ
ncbi:hypothetical protein WDV91_10155 [Curtobacterium flaccumfaciens pv. flaccumfaciens]